MNANPQAKMPPTEIVARFRNLPTAQKDRAATASELAESSAKIDALAHCLTSSVHQFDAQYGPTVEAFHPPRRGRQSPGTRLTLDRADNLGLRLSGLWLVENDSALDFFYVDREVSVAHRTAHPRAAYDIKTDLILGNAHDGTPIVAEVKRADPANPMVADADPFYAFMQALAAASILAAGSQIKRLAEHSPSEYKLRIDGPLDIYLIALNPAAGTWQGKLAETVDRIAEKLLSALGPASPLRRIAMLDMREQDRTLRITKRWMHTT